MRKAYTLITVFLPVLAVYSSPIRGFDLGTFVVLGFGVCCILDFFLRNKGRIKAPIPLLIVMIYTVVTALVTIIADSSVFYSSETSVIMRTARFIIMLFIMLFIATPSYFDYSLFEKYLRRVTLFVSIYAIIQLLFYSITGMKLINVFGATKQGVQFESTLDQYETTYRPPSIFLEPSNVTYYVVPYLAISLFASFSEGKLGERNKRRDFIDAVIITLGVVCTTSGQGAIVIMAAWGLWAVVSIFKKGVGKTIGYFPVLGIAAFVLFKSDSFQYTIGRLYTSGNEMSAIDARYTGYLALDFLSGSTKIFGTGYGNYIEKIYYPSFADIMFCTGVVGLVLVLIMYMIYFRKGCTFQKILVILSFVIMMGGGIYTATYLCFYLPLLLFGFSQRARRLKSKR
jgi:hypothetical protein